MTHGLGNRRSIRLSYGTGLILHCNFFRDKVFAPLLLHPQAVCSKWEARLATSMKPGISLPPHYRGNRVAASFRLSERERRNPSRGIPVAARGNRGLDRIQPQRRPFFRDV
jgi:hypothetical protein